MEQKHESLGNNVVPLNYILKFEPNLKTFRYRCSEEILVNIAKPTNKITLNAAELEFHEANVSSKANLQKARVLTNKSQERITLRFKEKIKGKALIQIRFTGNNNDRMYGFYRSRYTSNGRERFLLSSQFEAADARKAFPCFDEPEFKSTFEVSMLVDKDLDCISNTLIKSIEPMQKGKKLVIFNRTPRMSVYLLYLAVGKFEYRESKLGNKPIRIVTVPGKKQYTELPLEYTKKFVTFFEHYFGVKYPMKKLDIIAIPDFAAGAMENWGAITFREVALLCDKNSAVATKQHVAEVIAHELAHQWFGDLVTMKWWNDLWLNESFATFMSYKAMDSVYPKWDIHTQYLEDVVNVALSADQLYNTHPISVHVKKPGEIDEIFDEISYEKGGSVLNMLEDYVSKEIFRKGLHHYLVEHSYSNATKFDLWDSIAYVAKKSGQKMPVAQIASAWVNYEGYPMVRVETTTYETVLSQDRYVLSDRKVESKLWPIPAVANINGNVTKFLMRDKLYHLDAGRDSVIKLNWGQNGLYRVLYDDYLLSSLGEQVRSGKLSAVDSWGIENDLFAMVRSSRSALHVYYDFVNKYCLEAKYPLDVSILSHLNWLFLILYFSESKKPKEELKRFSKDLLKRLGYRTIANERNTDTMLRGMAISNAALAGDEKAIGFVKKQFKDFVHKKQLDANLRGVVYTLSLFYGGLREFNTVKKRYIREQVPEEKRRLLGALAFTQNTKLINSSLKFSLSKQVRLQDSFVIPAVVASTPAGRKVIWQWTRSNWRMLMRKFDPGTHMLKRFVANLSNVSDQKTRDEIAKFFGKNQNMRDDIKRSVKQTLEVIDANIRFLEMNSTKRSY